jgi:hypothetical protein
VQVADLLTVFVGMNENIVSTTVKGALAMAGDSVDLDVVQDAAAASGADILPAKWDVRRATCAVAKKWWCSFGYDYVLDAIRTRLREVIASILFSIST